MQTFMIDHPVVILGAAAFSSLWLLGLVALWIYHRSTPTVVVAAGSGGNGGSGIVVIRSGPRPYDWAHDGIDWDEFFPEEFLTTLPPGAVITYDTTPLLQTGEATEG